jgi:hypothetical protein
MARLRFETAKDLFDAFPLSADELMVEPTDEPCLDFVRSLVGREEETKAIGVCAYLLPRREAVWWACRSVRTLNPERSNEENQCLKVAEDWVKEPEEERRLAALEIGNQTSHKLPTSWLARAAGFAGGSMPFGEGIWVPIAPDQTARAIRCGVLTAVARVAPHARSELLRHCVEDGIRIASDEPLGF